MRTKSISTTLHNVIRNSANGVELVQGFKNEITDIILGGITEEQSFQTNQTKRFETLLHRFELTGMEYEPKEFEQMIIPCFNAWPTNSKNGKALASSSCCKGVNEYEPAKFVYNFRKWLGKSGYGHGVSPFDVTVSESNSFKHQQTQKNKSLANAAKAMAKHFGLASSPAKPIPNDQVPSENDGLENLLNSASRENNPDNLPPSLDLSDLIEGSGDDDDDNDSLSLKVVTDGAEKPQPTKLKSTVKAGDLAGLSAEGESDTEDTFDNELMDKEKAVQSLKQFAVAYEDTQEGQDILSALEMIEESMLSLVAKFQKIAA